MFEPLLELDDKGEAKPLLAERWEISPDGKTYTFHLRRGIKFHNGQEMTAEDAKFAIDYSLDPKNAATGRESLLGVARAEAVDPHTLRLQLREPSAGFLASLTSIKAFSLVPRGSIEEANEKPVSFPAGTGPFKFVEWQSRQRIALERHDDYWGDKPFVEKLVLRPIEDSTVRITALRAGDVDMVERAPYEWVREVRDGKLPGIGFAEASTGGYRVFAFNVAAPPFDNAKLRHAFAQAADKRELLHAAYYGFGEPGDQAYPKGHTWYVEGVTSPTFDLEKARALFREAGYTGQDLPFLVRQAGEEAAFAATLQAQMKKLGVNIRIDTADNASYTDRLRRGEFAFMLTGGSHDADPGRTYARDLRCPPDANKRDENQAGYCDPEMDALLTRLDAEMDPARRRDMVKQLVAKLNQDLPYLPIGFVPRYFMFRDAVKGFTTDGEGSFLGLNNTWLDR
jgi:peptide/nickel transport system substrate-binding protein